MAGGGKVSPRQKMINMMYLVLTAMLALNVSAEILKAFYLVEQSMIKAGGNIDSKNDDIMRSFQKAMQTQPEKTKPFNDAAVQVRAVSADFVKYVEDLKTEIVTEGGKIEMDKTRKEDGQLVQNSNISKHANLLVAPSGPQKGQELKDKINKARENMLAVMKQFKDNKTIQADAINIERLSDLRAEDTKGAKYNWQAELFEHSPQAAVVTLLTKIQNDAKNTESEILKSLFTGITADERSFDKLEAKIIPDKTSVSSGEPFRAKVILTAYDSKQANEVVINGKTYMPEGGVVEYEAPTGGVGEFEVKGVIKVAGKDGVKDYDFQTKYSVFKGEASISADAMNVLYIGLENPITIAVPGVSPNNIKASISNGSLTPKGGGKFIAKVTSRGEAKITVTVQEDGKSKSYTGVFRVRPIPKPEAMLGTLESGQHSAANIALQPGVFGTLGAGFAFDGVKYTIKGYNFVYAPKKGDAIPLTAVGSALTPQMKGITSRAKTGDRIIIDNVVATGPDGTRNLNPIVISVK